MQGCNPSAALEAGAGDGFTAVAGFLSSPQRMQAFMTLNFFSKPSSDTDDKRYRHVVAVSTWLEGRTHLPRDLVAALHYLIPELQRQKTDAFSDVD